MPTIYIAPLTVAAPASSPCADCREAGHPHSVHQVRSSGVTSRPASPFYDAAMQQHVHDWNQNTYWYECSNGHAWANRVLRRCEACGWTVDNQT